MLRAKRCWICLGPKSPKPQSESADVQWESQSSERWCSPRTRHRRTYLPSDTFHSFSFSPKDMSDKFRMFDILDVDMGGWWLSLSLGTQCLHQNRDETWSSDPGASMYKTYKTSFSNRRFECVRCKSRRNDCCRSKSTTRRRVVCRRVGDGPHAAVAPVTDGHWPSTLRAQRVFSKTSSDVIHMNL